MAGGKDCFLFIIQTWFEYKFNFLAAFEGRIIAELNTAGEDQQ